MTHPSPDNPDQRRSSQDQHLGRIKINDWSHFKGPLTAEALRIPSVRLPGGNIYNPLDQAPGLLSSLAIITDPNDEFEQELFDEWNRTRDAQSHSPPSSDDLPRRSNGSPNGAPSAQRRPSSEYSSSSITTAYNPDPSTTNGRPASNGSSQIPNGGSEPVPIAHPHSAGPSRPSPPTTGPGAPSNGFNGSYNGPHPPSQFNYAHPQHQNWMQHSAPPSQPFDPNDYINFGPGSPYADHHRQQMIRSAVMQGMQSHTQSQGPLHISTPNSNGIAIQPNPGASASPPYPHDFTFPANRDSGGVHAAADGTALNGGMPPSGSSPSPSPSYSSSNLSTPIYNNGPSPNFLQTGNPAGGSSTPAGAPPPPPSLHHPNPHKVSQSSLRSSSRPSPTPESGSGPSSRDSGHPYSMNRHGHAVRTRRNPSDPVQQQQQHGGVAPEIAMYGTRRTSVGPIPPQGRMHPGRRPVAFSPTTGRPKFEPDAGGQVRMMDPTTGQQPVQYANAQQWAHYMQGPYLDQAYNGPPPSAGGGEFVRTINRAGSSTSLTPSSESSLAGWNNLEPSSSSSLAGWNKTHSADDIPNFGQHLTDMQQQSPITSQREEWGQWGPMTADPAMMQQPPSSNSGFNPSLAGQHAAGGLPDNFYQEGLAFNNGQTGQSPKQFGQANNGMVVSPTSGMQSQPSVWNPTHPPSMGPSPQ